MCKCRMSRGWNHVDFDSMPTINRYSDLEQCCSTVQTPINDVDILSKCQVEGRSYYDGERIYPDGDSCFMCLCTPNFNNKTSFAKNSNCVKINCGIEHDLHRITAGCVPVYYKTPTCCPIDIKCPAKDDVVSNEETSNAENEKLTCTFGNLTLKLGQKLKNDNSCLNCECSIPPLLACIQKPNCSKSK
ncbi:uncharacterized protein LOC129574067 [Sitodiplosis mosellana]|uniref:uncharacterized protein LOC129574067 n=1 Tax=Sitodiplosis mosellana TaxID=263140 RepID=UPI00244433C4|nr:uncharacterized protein LOC129574067 [Sitodiplosis mosellana]